MFLLLFKGKIVILVLFFYVNSYAQSYWGLEFIPRVTTTILNESGMIPDNVSVIKHTPSYSFGFHYGYQILKNKTISIGINRYVNNYKTNFQSDYIPNKKWYFKTQNINSEIVNEPIISLSFQKIKILNSQNNMIRVGFSYGFTNTPYLEINKRYINENPNGQLDTIYWKRNIHDNNPIRVKLMLEYVKTIKLFENKSVFFDIGFNLRVADSEAKIYNTIFKENIEYNYINFRNSSGIGLVVRLSYFENK